MKNLFAPPRVPPISLTPVSPKEIVAPDSPSSTSPFANLLPLPFNPPPTRNFSAKTRNQAMLSRCEMQFKCRFRAGSSRIGVGRGCGQRSGAEVVANCGTDPRTRPAGNGEELSRMDESSPRVGRFPWLGWADGPRQGKASVGYSCPRVVHDRVHVDPRAKRRFRGSRPRKPPINRPLARPRRWNSSANEFVGSAGGINTGQSHRRKWPYNLSPSGRGAINRAALSANELLLSLLPPPEHESWKSTRKIGVASG